MKDYRTPWKTTQGCIVNSDLESIALNIIIDNAEFIVRAVNSHEQLLEAAHMLVRYLEIKKQTNDYDLIDERYLQDTIKAIAKAEVK